jgi:hypothetical protein
MRDHEIEKEILIADVVVKLQEETAASDGVVRRR